MNNNLLKRENFNSDEEFIAKVYESKIENSMTNKDCNEYINKILNTDLAESTTRGIAKYFNLGVFVGAEKALRNLEENTLLRELEEKKLELQKERIKLNTTKQEYNRNLRIDSRFELLYENIKDAIKTLEVPELYMIDRKENNNKSYVLNFSDVHYGACFKAINNEYSREICQERFNKLLCETVNYIIINDVKELIVINNGDSLQGILRVNDLKMNDIPIVEALVEFSQMMAKFLNQLSQYTYVKYYQVTSANHTELRLLNSKAGEMATEDMEKIIINYIGDMLINNERIYVHRKMKMDYIELEIEGYNVISIHGHQLKSPMNFINDVSQRQRKFFDYGFIGHFHGGSITTVGEGETNNIEVIISPSIVGSCPYADKLMKGSKAMAKIFKFERDNGIRSIENILLN